MMPRNSELIQIQATHFNCKCIWFCNQHRWEFLRFILEKTKKNSKIRPSVWDIISNLYIFDTAPSGRKLIEIRPRNYRVYIPLIAFRPKLQIKQTDALALSLTSHTKDKEQITPSTEPPSKMTMLPILALFSLAVYSNSFVWERTKIRGYTHQSSEFYQKKNDFLIFFEMKV